MVTTDYTKGSGGRRFQAFTMCEKNDVFKKDLLRYRISDSSHARHASTKKGMRLRNVLRGGCEEQNGADFYHPSYVLRGKKTMHAK